MPKWEYKKFNIFEDEDYWLERIDNAHDLIEKQELYDEVNAELTATQDKLKEHGWSLIDINGFRGGQIESMEPKFYYRRKISE